MRKERIVCIIILFLFLGAQASAQLKKAVQDLFDGDSTTTTAIVSKTSDSIQLKQLMQALDSAKLNEANMRMEMELPQMQAYAADSIKLAQQ